MYPKAGKGKEIIKFRNAKKHIRIRHQGYRGKQLKLVLVTISMGIGAKAGTRTATRAV